MASTPPQPSDNNNNNNNATIRTRITTDMNNSHQDSLSLFLQHYCALPAHTASSPSTTLTTVNLDSLILTCQAQRYYIPLRPALVDYDEMPGRMVAMHRECLAALHLSDVKIGRYLPPQGLLQRATFVTVAATMLAFSRRGNFVEGSWFYSLLGLGYVPGFAGFCRTIQPWLIAGVLAVHLGEAVWMARTRLRRHGIRRGSGLWWKWVGSCFIEGIGSFQRFDGMVEREKVQAEKKY